MGGLVSVNAELLRCSRIPAENTKQSIEPTKKIFKYGRLKACLFSARQSRASIVIYRGNIPLLIAFDDSTAVARLNMRRHYSMNVK